MSVRRLPSNRVERGCLNQEKGIVDGVGEFGIPEIWPEYDVDGVEKWISFNEVDGPVRDAEPEAAKAPLTARARQRIRATSNTLHFFMLYLLMPAEYCSFRGCGT